MKIIVFSGSGLSRESGLHTFRDAEDGLWQGYNLEEVASIYGWRANPAKVLDFYNFRRRSVLEAEPNEAHRIIADLERDHDVTVITQNVDDLHERAGSTRIIHLHGEVLKARTADAQGLILPWTGDLNLGDEHPETGVQLRPHIVWFGESLAEMPLALDVAVSGEVDVLIVVGTSLQVYPAAAIAEVCDASRVFVVDPEPPHLPGPHVTAIRDVATAGMRRVVELL